MSDKKNDVSTTTQITKITKIKALCDAAESLSATIDKLDALENSSIKVSSYREDRIRVILSARDINDKISDPTTREDWQYYLSQMLAEAIRD